MPGRTRTRYRDPFSPSVDNAIGFCRRLEREASVNGNHQHVSELACIRQALVTEQSKRRMVQDRIDNWQRDTGRLRREIEAMRSLLTSEQRFKLSGLLAASR